MTVIQKSLSDTCCNPQLTLILEASSTCSLSRWEKTHCTCFRWFFKFIFHLKHPIKDSQCKHTEINMWVVWFSQCLVPLNKMNNLIKKYRKSFHQGHCCFMCFYYFWQNIKTSCCKCLLFGLSTWFMWVNLTSVLFM